MMTMRSLFSLLFLAAAVSAFQPVRPVGVATTTTTTTTSTATFMFNKDKSAKALEEISAAAPLSEMSAPDSVQATSQMSKNVVRDMNTGEIKEVSWVSGYRNVLSWHGRRRSCMVLLLGGSTIELCGSPATLGASGMTFRVFSPCDVPSASISHPQPFFFFFVVFHCRAINYYYVRPPIYSYT